MVMVRFVLSRHRSDADEPEPEEQLVARYEAAPVLHRVYMGHPASLADLLTAVVAQWDALERSAAAFYRRAPSPADIDAMFVKELRPCGHELFVVMRRGRAPFETPSQGPRATSVV